ncbi:MAG: hypothetical protein R2877_06885 [Bdellovibrionota bacterium]
MAKLKIKEHVRNRTGLTVDMGLVYLYPFTGNGSIKNFRIQNPSGFYAKNVLSIDKIEFKGNHRTLYSDVTVIDQMKVSGIGISFEQKDMRNNFQSLYSDGVKYYRGEGSSVEEGLKGFAIRDLIIDPIIISIGPAILNKKVDLGGVHMTDVGTPEHGVGFYRFGRMLLESYQPEIQKAMNDPTTPLTSEMKAVVVRWLETHARAEKSGL